MSQLVQHKSGKGEKWKLSPSIEWTENGRDFWKIKVGEYSVCSFPKSEYILCDPPEELEDVTHVYKDFLGRMKELHALTLKDGDTLKVIDGPHNGPCFIVERRKA